MSSIVKPSSVASEGALVEAVNPSCERCAHAYTISAFNAKLNANFSGLFCAMTAERISDDEKHIVLPHCQSNSRFVARSSQTVTTSNLFRRSSEIILRDTLQRRGEFPFVNWKKGGV